jgi:predicted aminopeptidase
METRYGIDSAEYREMLESEKNGSSFVNFIQGLIAELDILYGRNDLNRTEKLTEKEIIINVTKERFSAEYENLFTNNNYRGFVYVPVNNAYLELFRLYYTEDNFFANLYEDAGRDLPAFIAAAKTITGRKNPREQLKNALMNQFSR